MQSNVWGPLCLSGRGRYSLKCNLKGIYEYEYPKNEIIVIISQRVVELRTHLFTLILRTFIFKRTKDFSFFVSVF